MRVQGQKLKAMISSGIKLSGELAISRIVHGHWRLADWKLQGQELLELVEQAIDYGVTTFDHADIYGNYTCEKLFGDALRLNTSLRPGIQIITKCGIKLKTERFPQRKIKIYDYSFDHIVGSVDKSLENLGTDYIDILLLHRPAPYFDPGEVARAFTYLKNSGKVLHFGVSNFNPAQFEMLNSFTDETLVTNQVEISPYCLEHFENGNIDFFLKEKIKPLAWSPLANGKLLDPKDDKGIRLNKVIHEIAGELNVDQTELVIFSWLLKHPVSIIPVIGTGKIDRIKLAVEALDLEMSLEQWYRIYMASTGAALP